MLKKILTLFFTFIFLSNFYSYAQGDLPSKVDNHEDNIVIKNLIPKRGEQNIISTPEIKIYYNSNFNLDKFKLYLNYEDVTNKTILTSKYIYYRCNTDLKKGMQVVKLEIPLNNKTQVTQWYFTVGSDLYNHYRGIFFNNTKEIFFLNSYDDLNNLCKNSQSLDYLFITEKINNLKKWNKLIDSCNKYSNNDTFLSIPSFELEQKILDKKYKTNISIFNSNNPFKFKDDISLDSFYKNLFYYEDDLIGKFQYDKNLNNLNFFKYSPYGDNIMSLIELNKNDTNDNLDLTYYKEALDNGWHLSPILPQYGNLPNIHEKNTFRTTILSESLSKSKILESIKNRRIYISSNNNINISFSLNKMPMGSIIKNPSYIRIIVSAINNSEKDKIKKIEIFSNNNKIIYTKKFNCNFAKIDFTLKPPKENTYYFAVITEQNNKKSVTSPIWIEK